MVANGPFLPLSNLPELTKAFNIPDKQPNGTPGGQPREYLVSGL